MMRGAIVLRPEPGNARTAALLAAAGVDVLRQPLFAVAPVDWRSPYPADFDALLLTSANALRHAGEELAHLQSLPALAVGEATAAAAREAGLMVALTGERDASALVATARERGFARLLHVTGRDRTDLPGVEALIVYQSDVLPIQPGAARDWEGQVALLHSVRAAQHFAALLHRDEVSRVSIAVAALSPAVRDAAGAGWADVVVADRPTDAALVACAVALIDPPGDDVDKQGAMSDFSRDRVESARGLRIGVVSVLVAVAFLIGLALAVVLVRRQTAGAELAAATPALTDPATPMAGPTLGPAPAAAPVPTQPAADPAALAAREMALAGQIAALEARAAALAVSADTAGGQASRAEALLVAVAARRALDRGMGLGALDEQLRVRLGGAQPRAVAIVHDAARQPVTLEDLRQGLTTLGPVLATGADRGWGESLREGLSTLVVLRRTGMPSPLPADRLARARRLLDQGQVEAARAEVAQLPGAGQAGGWLLAARRYVLARQALDLLENAALAGQAQPAPAPVTTR